MASFFPEGLPRNIFSILKNCADGIGQASLEQLLDEARNHLQIICNAHQVNRMVNYRLAQAIYSIIEMVVTKWDEIPEYSKYWFCGVIRYFSSMDDYENDIQSPLGLEDDVEVLNSCLRLAGLDQLVLNPEDFDDV